MRTFVIATILLAVVAAPAAADTILIGDSGGRLTSVDTLTGWTSNTVMTKNASGATIVMTDVAWDPVSRKLYGITFRDLYEINRGSGLVTHVGRLGRNDANALVFDSSGNLWAMGNGSDVLDTISTVNGALLTRLNPDGSNLRSAGDLEFDADGTLYLAGNTNPSDTLVTVSTADGSQGIVGTGTGNLGVNDLYGLAYSDGTMWGVAGTDIYSVNLATGATTYSASIQGGFSAVWGATMVVPAPPAVWMGLVLLAGLGARAWRRRRS